MYGIEIVAFVSSVGKVHLPSAVGAPSHALSDDDDAVEEALRPEFVELLKTVTREQVDAHATRCPHPETAERMVKVRTIPSPFPSSAADPANTAHPARKGRERLYRRHGHLHSARRARRAGRARV